MKNIYSFLITLLAVTNLFAKQEEKIITVQTDKLSMIFSVREDGKVYSQYFGDKISSGLSIYLDGQKSPYFSESAGPEIFPGYGERSTIEPALRLVHSDGVLTTELIYVSDKTVKIDDNISETVIHLKDRIYPIFVDIHFKAYKKENIICQHSDIFNEGEKEVLIEKMASSCLTFHRHSYYLTHFSGAWNAEMQRYEEKLTPGIKEIESKKGIRTTQSESPSFLLSLNGPANENYGEVYAGSLAWSGNYQLSFELDEYGLLHVLGGMNPFASTWHLVKGESISTPEMVLTYSSEGIGQISRNYHDWSRKYSLQHGNQIRPIVLNSWEGAYFSFNEETITGMIDNAVEMGIEMFVLDDGWFGNKYPRNSDIAGLGDWQTNTTKLPHGINYMAKYAFDKGLKFGIWIEPEMVNPDSELAKKHPEWIVKSGEREMLTMRNQWMLDLSNPAVQDFVVETFDNVMALSPYISYVKWDANRHVTNVGSQCLPADRQTHFWIAYVKGLYSAYERIRAKYPETMIQLCSSGGGRLDFGALRYHDEFWPSDNTNPLSRIYIQYGTNLFFPAMATASHVSNQTGMVTPLKFRFDVAMSGRLGIELQPKDIVGDDRIFATKAIETYKEIRPLVQFGDLYRLISPYQEGGWASLMYVNKDKSQAVFFAYSTEFHERTKFFECRLNGLDPAKKYKVTERNTVGNWKNFWGDNKIFSGEELMKKGVELDIKACFDSAVLLLTEI